MRFIIVMLPVALWFYTACKTNDFSGDGANAPVPSPTPLPPVPTPIPTPSPCVGDGVTVARLLTTEIKVNSANQYLDYEIQLTDCDGKPKALNNQPLKFDFDAITNSTTNPLAYELSVSDGSVGKINSTLQAIQGSDLFGKSGPKYAHWQTQSISFAATAIVIKLRLDLSQRSILPNNSTGKTLTAPVSIPTYLQLGNATPVQQNITVKP